MQDIQHDHKNIQFNLTSDRNENIENKNISNRKDSRNLGHNLNVIGGGSTTSSYPVNAIQLTMQAQSLQISDSNCSSEANTERQHLSVQVAVKKTSVYQCNHSRPKFEQDYKLNNHQGNAIALIGDAHLVNCNACGAYFPKSGALVIRALKRHTEQCKLYTSDILRSMYSQCQAKSGQRPELMTKISNSYQEVRNLIIDWLAEVAETLHLDIQKSAYHAVTLLDKFLSANLKNGKEMDQSTIMLQALCCLFIAAKNYEKDPNVPSSRKFLRQLPGYKPTQEERHHENMAYQCGVSALQGAAGHDNLRFNSKKNELVAQETVILNAIAFDMDSHPSSFDIIEIFMAQGILFTTDQHNESPVQDERCVNLLEKYIDFFVLLSLQDHKLVNTNQYLIACSITSAARKQCNINPVWPQELEQLTGLQHSHFCNIEKRLMAKFEQQYNQKNKIKKPESKERRPQQQEPFLQNQVPVVRLQVPNQSQDTSRNQQPQHVREVSKSNLLGRHQDSSLFRNMVNDNKQKYEQKIQAEQTANTSSETYESRQQQMRIKYGSNKTKQQYYTSRLQQQQTDQPQTLRKFSNPKMVDRDQNNASQTSINSNSSNSAIIRLKHQELQQKQGGAMVRQRSQVVANSLDGEKQQISISSGPQQHLHNLALLGPQSSSTKNEQRPQTNGGLIVNSSNQVKFMNVTGTIPKQSQKGQQLYSRELSNVNNKIASQNLGQKRGISQNSNGSVASTGAGTKFGNQKLSSDNKSLVRQALKNQKRNQKITIGESSQLRPMQQTTGTSSNGSNQGSVSAVQRIQRLRINSNNKVKPVLEEQFQQMQLQQQPRVGSNLPRVNNQKPMVINQRSLSHNGQTVIQGHPTPQINPSNTQQIKNKMKQIRAPSYREHSQGSTGSQPLRVMNDGSGRPGSSNQLRQNGMMQVQHGRTTSFQSLEVPNKA